MKEETIEVFELLVDDNTLPEDGQRVLLSAENGKSYVGVFDKCIMGFKISESKYITLFDVKFWKHIR